MAKMLIGGELVDSVSKDTYEVRNPATGAVVDTAPKGNEKDVLQAIQAAETAFKEWSDVTAEDRGNALMSACELIKKNSGEIAQLLTQEQGKTLFEAGLEIHHLVHGLEFYAGLALKVRGAHVPLPQKVPTAWSCGSPSASAAGSCPGIFP
jgi:succinate-semialdehyde dehydrogenase/glutarate-semialdehyde dehydrogenase